MTLTTKRKLSRDAKFLIFVLMVSVALGLAIGLTTVLAA